MTDINLLAPPFADLDLEHQLCGMLVNTSTVSDAPYRRCASILTPVMFAGLQARAVWDALEACAAVDNQWTPMNIVKASEGTAYPVDANQLLQWSSKTLGHNAPVQTAVYLRELYNLRQPIQAALTILSEAQTNGIPPAQKTRTMIDTWDKYIGQVITHRPQTVQEAVGDYIDALEQRGTDQTLRLSYGYPMLDRITRGMGKGHNIWLGAEQGMGKTTLVQNIIAHVCHVLKRHVYLWTGEMTEQDTVARFIAFMSGINAEKTEGGYISDGEQSKVVAAAGDISIWGLTIDTDPDTTIDDLSRRLEGFASTHPLDLVVIDYIDLLSRSRNLGRNDGDVQNVSYKAHHIQKLARRLNVPVIILSQFNRESLKGQPPTMHSFKGSSVIESAADLMLAIHNHTEDTDPDERRLMILKQRRGQMHIHIPFIFDGAHSLFVEKARPATQVQPHYSEGD